MATLTRQAMRQRSFIVPQGNLLLCRSTRLTSNGGKCSAGILACEFGRRLVAKPGRQFVECSESRDGRPHRFPSPRPSPSERGNNEHRALESRRDWIVLRGEKVGAPQSVFLRGHPRLNRFFETFSPVSVS